MESRAKPLAWRCRHNYPIVVESVEGGKRAWCLGCGQAGLPVGPDAQKAMRALIVEGQDREDLLRA
jgi:hypothetical protein